MRLRHAALCLALSSGALCAQEFVAPAPSRHEIVRVVPVTPKPSIEGIVKEIFETKKPWQLVNPLAPKSYGSGEKNVSKDHGPGTPYHSSGLIVMSVEW